MSNQAEHGQLLHLVFGGELTDLEKVEFRDLGKLDIVKWEHGNNPNKGKPGAKAVERAEEDLKARSETARASASKPRSSTVGS